MQIRALLFYDKRAGGARGLALRQDFPELLLRKGDRVEPWVGCADVASFESISEFPAKVLFWRSSCEDMTHHRNPLYSLALGVTPSSSSALDWLHILSLGVFQTWCAFAVHRMFRMDYWKTREGNAEARIALSCSRLSVNLTAWVRRENRAGRNLSEVDPVKRETFGTTDKPKFGLKSGESNVFLEYLVQLLGRDQNVGDLVASFGRDGAVILGAGRHLLSLLSIIRDYPKKLPTREIQRFYSNSKGYLTKLEYLCIRAKPKDHMLIEMALRVAAMGSPQLYGNWHDEGLNRLLRDVAGGAHSLVHERRILLEFPVAHDNSRKGLTTTKRRRRSF